jgi:hypothetical protein
MRLSEIKFYTIVKLLCRRPLATPCLLLSPDLTVLDHTT